MCKRLVFLLIGVLALGLSSLGWADVSVPTMFSDHAVLQRNMSVPVWGTASPGEQVTVVFGEQSKNTETSVSGDWMIYLAPMPESSSPTDMVITGNNVITITGVQVGEVWVGSGQSNMYNPLSGDCDASSAILTSGNFNIRFFNVGSGTPDGTIWEVCDSETSPSFSAVHFYFGRHLAKEMPNVPIGLIHSAVSATAIERWATCAGSGGLYLDQIKPLQPYAIQGVTWYQGEWDSRSAKDAEKYYWQLPCLINEWRTDWGQGNFPFYVVQLPRMGISNVHIIRRRSRPVGNCTGRETNAFITNVNYWRPPGNRNPDQEELDVCRPFVDRMIELTKPKLIVAAGGVPAKALLDTQDGIMRLRGSEHVFTTAGGYSVPLIPLLHPAYLLRRPQEKSRAWRDLQLVEQRLGELGG